MKLRFSLLASTLLLAMAGPCFSQQQPFQSPAQRRAAAEAAGLEESHDELVNLEKETARAILLGNTAFFKRVYGDEFLGTASNGQVFDKNTLLNNVASPQMRYSVFIASDIQVRLFLDTAVVNCLWTARGTRDGRSFDRQYRVTHVYIYGQRGWQAISAQETLLPG